MVRAWAKNWLFPRGVGYALRLFARTWRITLSDRSGLTRGDGAPCPVIWIFWHNRLLIAPILYRRFFRERRGAALISRSRDGGLLAHCIRYFGGEVVRGSTSRGGSRALAQLHQLLSEGCDIYITPDGPRGPRYNMGPGAVWLALRTGVPIQPVNVEYSSVWRLGSWDGFIIPKPFAKIDVTLQPLHNCVEATGKSDGEHEDDLLGALMRETILQ